jgi:dienelactone hydrolase
MKFLNPIAVILSLVSSVAPVGVAAEATSIHLKGEEIKYQGLTLYVSKPHKSLGYKKPGSRTGVLFLTDIYGLKLKENKELADNFAKEGYITVVPDLFKGSPAPSEETPGFNATEFLAKYPPSVTDPVVAKAIKYLRQELKVNKVAATGYCYGGRYVFRELDKKGGVDVGFTAHPSLLQTEEIEAVTKPVSIAGAATDNIFPQPRQAETNAILTKIGKPFSSTLYSGTTHGFAVRANTSDPQQAFAKTEAFYQAVRFFEAWD